MCKASQLFGVIECVARPVPPSTEFKSSKLNDSIFDSIISFIVASCPSEKVKLSNYLWKTNSRDAQRTTKVRYVFVIRHYSEIELGLERELIEANLSEGATGREDLTLHATGKVFPR